MEWMILPLKRYAQFRGRSRRKEFWMWVLFLLLVTIVLSILDTVLGLGGRSGATLQNSPERVGVGAGAFGGVLTGVFSIAMLIPNLAVQVRRLHDTDRSGWWLLGPLALYLAGAALMLAALLGGTGGAGVLGTLLFAAGAIGFVVLLVFFCLDGTRGTNRFGADPKDPAGGADLDEVFR